MSHFDPKPEGHPAVHEESHIDPVHGSEPSYSHASKQDLIRFLNDGDPGNLARNPSTRMTAEIFSDPVKKARLDAGGMELHTKSTLDSVSMFAISEYEPYRTMIRQKMTIKGKGLATGVTLGAGLILGLHLSTAGNATQSKVRFLGLWRELVAAFGPMGATIQDSKVQLAKCDQATLKARQSAMFEGDRFRELRQYYDQATIQLVTDWIVKPECHFWQQDVVDTIKGIPSTDDIVQSYLIMLNYAMALSPDTLVPEASARVSQAIGGVVNYMGMAWKEGTKNLLDPKPDGLMKEVFIVAANVIDKSWDPILGTFPPRQTAAAILAFSTARFVQTYNYKSTTEKNFPSA